MHYLRKKTLTIILLVAGIISILIGSYVIVPKMMVVGQALLYLSTDYVKKDELDINSMTYTALKGILKASVDPNTALSEGGIKALLSAISDPYTRYINRNEFQEFLSEMNREIIGIGVMISTNDSGQIIITNVLPDSPAEKAGVTSGDILLSVDGNSLSDIAEAGSLLRGDEATTVVIEVIHPGEEIAVFITIKRAKITVPSVNSYTINDTILYIRLYSFSDNSATEFIQVLSQFDNEIIVGLILDLRDNPGGLLNEAVTITSQFLLKDTVVVHQVNGNFEVKEAYYSEGPSYTHYVNDDFPVAILINGGTASASEVVAGALRDKKNNSILIGTESYGKGAVNHVFRLIDGSALVVTSAYWLTPNSYYVGNDSALIPDILIQLSEMDAQLDAAIEHIIDYNASR